jgi:nucleotide-binding universal stress UspA family protein
MGETPAPNTPFVNSVFHPSDFSAASENAFAHALALALVRKTEFTILHTGGSGEDWTGFPAVRATLERWGTLEPGSPRSAVFEQLAVRIKKVRLESRNPVEAILHYLAKHPTDLIVLATEGRTGLPSWLQPSVAERVAERSGTKTLFVPDKARGFVSRQDVSWCPSITGRARCRCSITLPGLPGHWLHPSRSSWSMSAIPRSCPTRYCR